MQKQSLNSRQAITILVESFYVKVKADDLLGPIFNNLKNFNWDTHIPVMVDFWEAVLMHSGAYKGNAMLRHIELNRRTPLTAAHFDRWKALFYETLDTLFEGPEVIDAHKRVESMSALIQYKIAESGKKGFIQ